MPNSWRTHHDRSGNCALRFRHRTQSRAQSLELRRLLSLCFTILVALPRRAVTLNALKNAESYLWTVFTKIYRHELRFFLIASRERENAAAVSRSVGAPACSRISPARSADTTDKSIRIIVFSRKSQFKITANFLPRQAPPQQSRLRIMEKPFKDENCHKNHFP